MKRLLNLLTKLFSRPKNWLSWVVGLTVAIAMIIIVVPGTPVWPEHERNYGYGPPRIEQPPHWTVTFWSDEAPNPDAKLYPWSIQVPDPERTLRSRAHDYSHGWPLEWMRQTHCAEKYVTTAGSSSLDFPGEHCWIPLPEKVIPTVDLSELASVFSEEPPSSFEPNLIGSDPPVVISDRRWDKNIIDWATSDAWPWSGDYQWLRIGVLLLDLMIALVIVLGVTRLFDWWLTYRSKGWSVRLGEMLFVIAVGCVVLGWWQYHVQLQKKEREVIHNKNIWTAIEGYCGPVWLSKLIGNREYLPAFCMHPVKKTVWVDNASDEELESLKNLTFLERVTIRSGRPAPSFPRKGPIKALDAPKMVSFLQSFRRLKQINFVHEGIRPEQIPQFFALTTVDRFNVDKVGMTVEDYQRLRQLDPRVVSVANEDHGLELNFPEKLDSSLLESSEHD